MKSQVETYIPKALKACRELLIEENTKNVKKEYDGYAAALGMNIINAGLLTAISFYTDIHRKAEEKAPKRFKILKAIVHILNDDGFNIRSPENVPVILPNNISLAPFDASKMNTKSFLMLYVEVKNSQTN